MLAPPWDTVKRNLQARWVECARWPIACVRKNAAPAGCRDARLFRFEPSRDHSWIVGNPYLQAFAAAAALGGLGGLAQIGNDGSILSPSTQIRNGISGQMAEEGEQVLNHFLNRLPIITLKEGSRARVYVGRDILIPSYAEPCPRSMRSRLGMP
jgi:hypothetical protein